MKQNNIKIGSSETTREAFVFNFNLFLLSALPPLSSKKNTEQKRTFLEWFIGFTEGNGIFGLTKYPITFSNKKTKNRTPCCFTLRPCFLLNQKQPQVLYKIKKELRFGTVTQFTDKTSGSNYYRYSVYKLSNIKQLIQLFNGNLLLNKVNTQFIDWVAAYNTVCDQQIEQKRDFVAFIIPKPYFAKNLDFNSAWLTGFTDADGGFYASLKEKPSSKKKDLGGLKQRERYKFYITQKGELDILQQINRLVQQASFFFFLLQKKNKSMVEKKKLVDPPFFFDTTKKPNKKAKQKGERNSFSILEKKKQDLSRNQFKHICKIKKDIYRLELTRILNLEILIQYFDTYPLLTTKRLMFIRWKRVILRRHELKQLALRSEKGMRRYKNLYASIGKKKKIG